MKYNRIFRILDMVVILSLLVVVIPATHALAYDYDIDLDPSRGEINEYFYVEGKDFRPSDYGEPPYYSGVDIYFSSQEADKGDDIYDDVTIYEKLVSAANVDEDGEFKVKVKVPDELADGSPNEDVHAGTYYVCVTSADSGDIKAVTKFTVITAEIELDPKQAAVATEVDIYGKYFVEWEPITIEYNGVEVDIEGGDEETDRYGWFTCTILIPESTAGAHAVTVTDEAGSEVVTDFTVEPEITATPTTAALGDTVTVKGTGFGSRNDVDITFDGDDVATDETDEDGSFQVSFTVPLKAPDTHKIKAEDEDRNKDDADFTIAASIQLTQTMGNVGTKVTINGSGFQPNANITINYGTEPMVTSAADALGKFSAIFTVPKSTAGTKTITASDGTGRSASATFTMESEAPPIPQPLVPDQDAKAKSRAYFIWETVTDPSGITYTLQIATDEEFTDIVLERTDIADSEYTLTKEDGKLKSTKEDASYYWRVRAVDGASNESEWTSPGSFYVGFAFPTMPRWVIYTLFGLGALLLGLIGFRLASRHKFRSETS